MNLDTLKQSRRVEAAEKYQLAPFAAAVRNLRQEHGV